MLGEWDFIPVEPKVGPERAAAYVEAVELVQLTHDKPRWVLAVTGSLPTPCNQPRAFAKMADGQLHVTLYSVREPAHAMCVEVLHPFQGYIDLSPWIDEGWSGEVWLNGQLVGRIE